MSFLFRQHCATSTYQHASLKPVLFYRIRRSVWLIVALSGVILLTCWPSTLRALEFCNPKDGGGICPTGNTCCLYNLSLSSYLPSSGYNSVTSSLSSCIPNDLGSYNATCCHDVYNDGVKGNSATTTIGTGCPLGYTCATGTDFIGGVAGNGDNTDDSRQFCLAAADESLPFVDPLLSIVPRYPIYPCPQIQNVYGFSIRNNNDNSNKNADISKLAYYSSRGDIQTQEEFQWTTATSWMESIRLVIVMLHGANRNADDYFCSLHAILQKQQQIQSSNVLLLVPWFVSTNDSPGMQFENGGIPFRWDTTNDASGPWRYGANAISFTPEDTSSFALFDEMIAHLLKPISKDDSMVHQEQYPNIRRIVVAGHSSGGQFVQRWSIVTPIWDDRTMKSIVANPSSYAYLTPRRHIDTEWRVPNTEELFHCPDYNEWEWGIGTELGKTLTTDKNSLSTNIVVPQYVQNAIARYGNIHHLTSVFSMRDVTYLAGGLDVCNVPDKMKPPNGWCNSHGLETSCRDLMQGSNRLERHHWYCTSLQLLNISHRCYIVPYVGHDHSLIFSSDIGMSALFGSMSFAINDSMTIE